MRWKDDDCKACGTCEFQTSRPCEFYIPSEQGCENYERRSRYEDYEDEDED